jgi:hypothetical protein
MIYDILAILSQTALTVVASVMIISWKRGLKEKALVAIIVLLGIIGVGASIRAIILNHDAQQIIEGALTGDDRFGYVCADPEDLKNKASQIRFWIYATNYLDVLEVHFGAYGISDPKDPGYRGPYVELPRINAGRSKYVLTLPKGDYRIELQHKGRVVVQNLKIVDWGDKYLQIFDIRKKGETLLESPNGCPE